jgi:hypothetical protein
VQRTRSGSGGGKAGLFLAASLARIRRSTLIRSITSSGSGFAGAPAAVSLG